MITYSTVSVAHTFRLRCAVIGLALFSLHQHVQVQAALPLCLKIQMHSGILTGQSGACGYIREMLTDFVSPQY